MEKEEIGDLAHNPLFVVDQAYPLIEGTMNNYDKKQVFIFNVRILLL